MTLSKAALFGSGLFFGGAIDHAILATMRRDVTPYGIKSGVTGNWLLAGLDCVAAVLLYRMHLRQERCEAQKPLRRVVSP